MRHVRCTIGLLCLGTPGLVDAQVIDCVCDSRYQVGDLVQLLDDNPDGSTLLAGDSNEDGWVDVGDILEVISNWGACGS